MMTKECGNMPCWLISIIAFVLATIAKDKKRNGLKVVLYLIGIGSGTIAAIQIWVRNFSVFVYH